jgi:hypothetical protein
LVGGHGETDGGWYFVWIGKAAASE